MCNSVLYQGKNKIQGSTNPRNYCKLPWCTANFIVIPLLSTTILLQHPLAILSQSTNFKSRMCCGMKNKQTKKHTLSCLVTSWLYVNTNLHHTNELSLNSFLCTGANIKWWLCLCNNETTRNWKKLVKDYTFAPVRLIGMNPIIYTLQLVYSINEIMRN